MSNAASRLNTPISTAELNRRWTAVRAAMEAGRLDVLLMQANNDYIGGYIKYFTDLPATQGYSAILAFPFDGGMTWIGQGPFDNDRAIDAQGDGQWRGVSRVMTCPSYASAGYTHAYEADLAGRALSRHARGRIGLVGLSTLSHHLMSTLASRFPEATFVDASDLVDRIKAIKSAEEVERLRATAAMQDAAMAAAVAAFQPGRRDRDITAAAERVCLEAGSEQGLYMCASAPRMPGAESAHFGNRHFQNRIIGQHDQFALLIESSGPGGYYCELGRTFVHCEASDAMHGNFAFILKARRFMLDMLKPGASCGDIWTGYNAFMREHGQPEEKRLHCHSMGYDMVERPLVRFDEPMTLESGMVVSCHPTFESEHGMHWICDNYLIGKNGAERLHGFPEKIVEIY